MGAKRKTAKQTVASSTLSDAERRKLFDKVLRNFEKVRKSIRRPRGLTTRQLIEEGRRY